MTEPTFTVVVPTYRRPALLRAALASVAVQTLPPVEVVVVDDGGDQETRAVASSFPGVTYVVNDRARGGSGARNAGLARASGGWVAFLDDDDEFLPHKLEAVAALLRSAGPEVGLVYSAAESFDAETGETLTRTTPTLRGHVLDEVLYRNAIGGMSVVVARRDLLERVGGFDERFPSLQDMELYVRLAQVCEFELVPEVLVRVRVARDGRISSDPHRKLVGAKLFAEKYADLIARSARLRHRTASRTFVLALAAGDRLEAARSLPWTAAGVVVDPANMSYVARGLVNRARAVVVRRAGR